jgi:Icc-related predicted phosphoesterase
VVGALGDIHGDFPSARRIMERHPDVPFWVCVGDLADADGNYEGLPSPLYWIKGNNENFDLIASGGLPANLRYLGNGQLLEMPALTIAGLGGTFAPTWYETRAEELPHPRKGSPKATELADKRRHFVREEVNACVAMRGVDLFMTHEAPRPYRIGRLDAGKTPVNEILAAMKPRLHLFGHHHRFSEQQREGVRSVGLDLVSRSYLMIRPETMEYHIHTV